MGKPSRETKPQKGEDSRRSRKRKREEAVTDLPDTNDADEDGTGMGMGTRMEGLETNGVAPAVIASADTPTSKAKGKKQRVGDYDMKRAKKDTKVNGRAQEEAVEDDAPYVDPSVAQEPEPELSPTDEIVATTKEDDNEADDEKEVVSSSKNNKKQKKKKRKGKENTAGDGSGHGGGGAPADSGAKTLKTAQDGPKGARFIVFIGNLPYTATTESISAHFHSLQPFSMRHLTLKDSPTGRSKGYAFLEFPTYDRMTTCLQLFHHSMFKDGVSPSRKINVELTAGGGGAKSTQRKEKLKVKNEKLNQERKRRKKTEAEQNGAATKKKGKKANENKGDKEDAEPADDIHPSRRSRVRRA